jgi:hypothetical protein
MGKSVLRARGNGERVCVRLTDLTLSCAAGPACRSRSGAAVAGEKLRATTAELQPP